VSKERKNIDEYRALLDQVTTKVRVALTKVALSR
jgi:hypothetical protein